MWLFNTLFNRSKANKRIFDFPSLKNRFPTKKAFCFSLLAVWSVCFLNLFFYYLFFYSFFSVLVCRLFGFRVHDYYKTVFQNCKTFWEIFFLIVSKTTLLRIWNARTRGRFISNWISNKYKKWFSLKKIFSFAKIKKAPFQCMYKIKICLVYWLSDYYLLKTDKIGLKSFFCFQFVSKDNKKDVFRLTLYKSKTSNLL